jgi:hypothetical protein
VIVTKTDHDFVDLTIKATAEAGAKKVAKTATKSLAKKVARKAAFGLAASAAVLGALAASHSHGSGQEPVAKTVAAVSPATSVLSGKAAGGTSEAQGAHLTTTFHHPFYDETRSAFVEGKDLKAGDVLQTPTGTAEVTGVRLYHAHTITYDLTIGTLHTYYVLAGATPVLVHNCDGSVPSHRSICDCANGGKPAMMRGPKPAGTGPHNLKIAEVADQVTDGQVIAGGGRLPEREFATPGGFKGSRRPDVLVQRPDGSMYGINVGKQTMRSGAPIKREAEALQDLEGIGIPMHFVAYN